MNIKRMLIAMQLLFVVVIAQAQMLSPVKFSSQLKTNGTAEAEIIFSGKIQPVNIQLVFFVTL